MPDFEPGDEIEYVVTYLEMTARPGFPWPQLRSGTQALLVKADAPPPWYFLTLYDAVGGSHEWTDWHRRDRAELAAFVGDPKVELFTLLHHGWPAGFFMLDTRNPGECNLAYFGLVPEALGLGLGRWLLETAVLSGWERPGVTRMTVNTNTLDHPAALSLYQKVGFAPVDREVHRRVLTRPRTV